jgi:hypothetical protein
MAGETPELLREKSEAMPNGTRKGFMIAFLMQAVP